MAAADARGVIEGPPLQAGQRVRIIAGAFADKLAIIERLDDAGRVRVLLDIVSGRVPVTIGARHARRARNDRSVCRQQPSGILCDSK